MATLPLIPGLSGLLGLPVLPTLSNLPGLPTLPILHVAQPTVSTQRSISPAPMTKKRKQVEEKQKEREALKKEKEAHNLRLLEAKAKIFPQFVADYYDAKKAGDDARLRAAWKVCRDVYRELPLNGAGHWSASVRTRNKFCELAIRETDAYLRKRFPKSTDLKHRTRLAKLLRRVDGPSWKHLACNYRGVTYHREQPNEEEIIGWPGLVGFPDPK